MPLALVTYSPLMKFLISFMLECPQVVDETAERAVRVPRSLLRCCRRGPTAVCCQEALRKTKLRLRFLSALHEADILLRNS